ncbi:MAG: hypothetical protein AMS24_02355 [Chlamydiae bacterium SM23_39]|nr:MAG: hypothetical protein AMS24_02355 [Chlamydiae bacterium SM23_39]
MIKFPLNFEVYSEATSGICNKWKIHINAYEPITCCIPTEFYGPGEGYTPEDFFALSILNCMIASFKIACEKENANFDKVKTKAKLIMNLDANNKLIFSEINIIIDVEGASDIEKVKKILERSVNDCPVSNAIKTPKTLQLNVK